MTAKKLAQRLVNRLTAKGWQVATAESCTGGLLAGQITEISGSSNVFSYGIIAYANEIKEKELSVPAEILSKYGAVSAQTAIAMAEGVRRRAGAQFGAGITGIAGPGGGTPEKPVGTVYIAVAGPMGVRVRRLKLGELGDRQRIRLETVRQTLRLLNWGIGVCYAIKTEEK